MNFSRGLRTTLQRVTKHAPRSIRYSSIATNTFKPQPSSQAEDLLPFSKPTASSPSSFGLDKLFTRHHDAELHQLQKGKLFDENTGRINVKPTTLREACRCPRCVDPSDQQKNYSFADIPTNISVQSYNVDSEGTYSIQWTNDVSGFDKHVSHYEASEIEALGTTYSKPGWDIFKRPIQLMSTSTFDLSQSTISFKDYMHTSTSLANALHLLWRDGLVFINDIPESESAVIEIAERIGPLRNTFYGSTWNVRSVPLAKNVAYTNKYLGFHMDLLYMKEPPGLQFLHCLQNSCTGGESQFADTLKAADIVLSKEPAAFDIMASTEIKYQYFNDDFFYSDVKPFLKPRLNASQPARNASNAQNPDHIAQIDRMYWSPPFVGSALRDSNTPHVEESVQVAKQFADALESDEVLIETKLPAGTCAIFDNLRTVHARKAFDVNSGHRWLKGTYVDYQDFCSRASQLEKEMPR